LACLELHTYSSLNPNFLTEYKNSLDAADVAVVYYAPESLVIKRMEAISKDQIANAFERDDLIIFTEPEAFKKYILEQNFQDLSLLLMSSGNYGGLDFESLKSLVL
jgi:UDP-N-acetylmuramate: L-alanyl-gamma-D-glutamyl-meso-diaminopimelate ligase